MWVRQVTSCQKEKSSSKVQVLERPTQCLYFATSLLCFPAVFLLMCAKRPPALQQLLTFTTPSLLLSLQCPTCKTIYGVKTGNQPAGKMEYHVIPHSLPGHPDCKTIRIIYNIPPGIQVPATPPCLCPSAPLPRCPAAPLPLCPVSSALSASASSSWLCFVSPQGPEHPNAGKPFTARGFPRHCYLPDSEKGRKVRATHTHHQWAPVCKSCVFRDPQYCARPKYGNKAASPGN